MAMFAFMWYAQKQQTKGCRDTEMVCTCIGHCWHVSGTYFYATCFNTFHVGILSSTFIQKALLTWEPQYRLQK